MPHAKTVAKWSNDIKFEKRLLVDAKSYCENLYTLWDVEPIFPQQMAEKTTIPEKQLLRIASPNGNWLYAHMVLPAGRSLKNGCRLMMGTIAFDGDVVIPTLFYRKRSEDKFITMMSLTPMEMFTLRDGVEFAHGKTAMYGMGLGWSVLAAARKPGVELVLVEKDRDLVDWIWPKMLDKFPELSSVVVVIADAYDFFSREQSKFDCHVWDIWPGYADAWEDVRFRRACNLHPKVWGWGGTFSQEDAQESLELDSSFVATFLQDEEDDGYQDV